MLNETMLRSTSLLIVVYIIFAYYTLQVSRIKRDGVAVNRVLPQIVTLSFLFIAILLLSKVAVSISVGLVYESLDDSSLIGLVLQFAILPLLYARIKMGRQDGSNNRAISLWAYMPMFVFAVNIILYVIPAEYRLSDIANGFMAIAAFSLVSVTGYLFFKEVAKVTAQYSNSRYLFSRYGGCIFISSIAAVLILISAGFSLLVCLRSEYIILFVWVLSILNIPIAINVFFPYSELERDLGKTEFILSENIFNEKDKSGELRVRLIRYFETEKPYLKPDLTVAEVALYLYSNKTYISRVINDSLGLNFSQFANKYRVEEAKRLYMENTSLSVTKLCFKAGFGSIATFTISFRLFTGLSPAEWCKECRKGQKC